MLCFFPRSAWFGGGRRHRRDGGGRRAVSHAACDRIDARGRGGCRARAFSGGVRGARRRNLSRGFRSIPDGGFARESAEAATRLDPGTRLGTAKTGESRRAENGGGLRARSYLGATSARRAMGREGDDLPGARVMVRNTPEEIFSFFLQRRIERFGQPKTGGFGSIWAN